MLLSPRRERKAFTSCKTSFYTGKRTAFTLIELLVVIAIIAILAAILFPVFAQARDKARQTSCLSNEKQIILGLIQYQQDYDEMLPATTRAFPPAQNVNRPGVAMNIYDGSWIYFTQPYIKSTQLFVCPSGAYDAQDGEPSPNPLDSGDFVNANGSKYKNLGGPVVSYGMTPTKEAIDGAVDIRTDKYDPKYYVTNGSGYGVPPSKYESTGGVQYQGVGGFLDDQGVLATTCSNAKYASDSNHNLVINSLTNADIYRPAQAIVIYETNMWDGGACGAYFAQARGRHIRQKRNTLGIDFTLGIANVAFADGHIKGMRSDQVYDVSVAANGKPYYTYLMPLNPDTLPQ